MPVKRQLSPILLSSKALVGGGVGVSFFHGIIRFDLSRPISPNRWQAPLRYRPSRCAVKPTGLAVLFILAACKGPPDTSPAPASWRRTGPARTPARSLVTARAEWCGRDRFLEIRGVRGDTGLALALFPRDTVVPGRYQVRTLPLPDSTRPAASVGLRLFAQTAIKGFQGDSGSVQLRRSKPGVFSGEIDARARSVSGIQRVHLTGTFHDLTILPQVRGCSPPPPSPPSPKPARP